MFQFQHYTALLNNEIVDFLSQPNYVGFRYVLVHIHHQQVHRYWQANPMVIFAVRFISRSFAGFIF